MEDSLFTKIIKGEIPCHKVYEDEKHIVILDIQPMHSGHCLVIPKKQIPYIWDMEDSDYQSLMGLVKKIGTQLRWIMKTERTGVLVDGSDVAHVHVHVIPFNKDMHETRLPKSTPDHEKLAEIASRIKESISSLLDTSEHSGKSSRDAEVSFSERSESVDSASEETEFMRSSGVANDSGISSKEDKDV